MLTDLLPNRRFSQVMEITPALALDMLGHNASNRSIRPGKVREYRTIMEEGRWRLTPQGVGFTYRDGVLLLVDGQHRLRAIAESGKVVPMVVTVVPEAENADGRLWDVLDQGTRRDLVDLIHTDVQIEAIPVVGERHMAAAINALAVVDVLIGKGVQEFDRLTPQARLRLYHGHEAEVAWATSLRARQSARSRGLPAGVLACGIMAYRTDPERAEGFFMQVVSGEHLTIGDPAYALREAIVNRQGVHSPNSLKSHVHWYGLTLTAWRHFVGNKGSIKILRPSHTR